MEPRALFRPPKTGLLLVRRPEGPACRFCGAGDPHDRYTRTISHQGGPYAFIGGL